MERVPLMPYQRLKLEELFFQYEKHAIEIYNAVENITLANNMVYELAENESIPPAILRDKEKECIMNSGSLIYNKLLDILEQRHQEMASILEISKVKELYRYCWIWSEDQQIMSRGDSWFTDREKCRDAGNRNTPSYDTYDHPAAPYAILCIEAVCSNKVQNPYSMEKCIPCSHGEDVEVTDEQLAIDNLNVARHHKNKDASGDQNFEYVILETGKVFKSPCGDIKRAYNLMKRLTTRVETKPVHPKRRKRRASLMSIKR